MKKPTLSVLMPNYNHARFLTESLTAILTQSYPPTEVIVIDDCSTDNSVEIIEKIAAEHPNVRLIQNEKNLGNIENANRLVGLSSGDYLYFAASDDRVLPGFFEKTMNMLLKHPQAGLCMSMYKIIDEDGKDKEIVENTVFVENTCYLSREDVSRLLIEGSNFNATITAIFRRNALIGLWRFDPYLGSMADGFIAMGIALQNGVCYIPEVLTTWRRMEGGYCASFDSDPAKWRKIVRYASALMQTTFKDIFPNEFVERWAHAEMNSMFVRTYSAYRAALDIFMDKMKQDGISRIALYGIGPLAELVFIAADRAGVEVAGLFDGYPEKQGRVFMGLNIQTAEALDSVAMDAVLITSTAPRFIHEIKQTIAAKLKSTKVKVIVAAKEVSAP